MFCCFGEKSRKAAADGHDDTQEPQRQQPSTQSGSVESPQRAEPRRDITGSGPQHTACNPQLLQEQLTQLLLGAPAASTRSNDLWANLQKTADTLVSALVVTASSFYIFTTSRRFCKVVPNSSSPHCAALRKSGWELCHAAECPSAAHVASSRSPSCFQAPSPAHGGARSRAVPVDLQLLHSQAGCQHFVLLPVYQGQTAVGALLLAHTEPIPNMADNKWLSTYLPLLSLYLAETAALKLVNFTEKIQTATGLSHLAWIVSSELDSWFDWCHPDDTEARLVLLAPDQSAAMVLSRSVGAMRTFDPVNSIDVLVSGGLRSGPSPFTRRSNPNNNTNTDLEHWCLGGGGGGAAGQRGDHSFASRTGAQGSGAPVTGSSRPVSVSVAPEEGLLGTHMSLSNTLTRRCLAEGSKLLFVADVMAALKKYGEPWKDVFMDQSRVTNPTWVVAAPIAHGGRHLGAILWLSSSRLNPNMLAQSAKASVPPLLHTVARQVVHLRQQLSSAAGNGAVDDPGLVWMQLLALPHLNMLSGATATTGGAPVNAPGDRGAGPSSNPFALDTADMNSSQGTMMLGAGRDGMGGSVMSEVALAQGGDVSVGGRQLRYTVMVRTDSVSTSALVRAYQTAIAQHQRAATGAAGQEAGSAYEEIQVIAKAGQGAFGSVYVALWKGLVVAVKVMRQQADGRRAMRTAWELAVTKSISHPNIVMVYATFTDVVVVKLSKRLIRFVPAATTLADPAVSSSGGLAGPGGGGAAGPHSGSTAGGEAAAGASGSDTGARCQVIIMEYCNLGPLHHYVAERRHATQLGQQQADRERQHQQHLQQPHLGGTSVDDSNSAAADATGPLTNASNAYPSGPIRHAASSQGGLLTQLQSSGSNSSSGMLQAGVLAGLATGPVEFSTTLATLVEVASALQYLHSLGFIHCDLKPENVLLKAAPGDPRGFTVKVSDFGLSELLTSDGPLMGELGGTVTHIAPEIVTHKRVTKAADSYAFGVVMWELITGSRIYSDLFNSGREKRVRDKLILAKVAHEGLRPVFPENIPYEYVMLARRCWATDPSLRPTFTDVISDLELMQRKYCRTSVPNAAPGLEGLVPPAAAAAGPAGVAGMQAGGGSPGVAAAAGMARVRAGSTDGSNRGGGAMRHSPDAGGGAGGAGQALGAGSLRAGSLFGPAGVVGGMAATQPQVPQQQQQQPYQPVPLAHQSGSVQRVVLQRAGSSAASGPVGGAVRTLVVGPSPGGPTGVSPAASHSTAPRVMVRSNTASVNGSSGGATVETVVAGGGSTAGPAVTVTPVSGSFLRSSGPNSNTPSAPLPLRQVTHAVAEGEAGAWEGEVTAEVPLMAEEVAVEEVQGGTNGQAAGAQAACAGPGVEAIAEVNGAPADAAAGPADGLDAVKRSDAADGADGGKAL